MKLIFVQQSAVGVSNEPPPPEWPTADHTEPDKGLAAEKIASGWFKEKDAPPDAPKAKSE